MSCTRMENKILPYVDGRLKESERVEVEKHLASCSACQLRVNGFRMVSGFLDELPEIEPSPAFDVRVRARVAAEPKKQGWWALFTPSPRVVFAATLLLLATVWIGSRPFEPGPLTAEDEAQINANMPVLENYDVLSEFGALTELPQPVQDDGGAVNPEQNQNQDNEDQDQSQNQTK